MIKAPSNEEELRIFLKRIEIEMELKMDREWKEKLLKEKREINKERIVREFRKELLLLSKEIEMPFSILEVLIGKKLEKIDYDEIDDIIEKIGDFVPSFAEELRTKIEKLTKEEML